MQHSKNSKTEAKFHIKKIKNQQMAYVEREPNARHYLPRLNSTSHLIIADPILLLIGTWDQLEWHKSQRVLFEII